METPKKGPPAVREASGQRAGGAHDSRSDAAPGHPGARRSSGSYPIRGPLQDLLLRGEAAFDRVFGPRWNPISQMGTLAFYFFWIVAVSGIYVYILFKTSVAGAYGSVEYMTREQWYLGGVMRSLHRYASDGMVLAAALHLLREFILDRYRGVRWYAWFTGVPILWFLYMSGLSGYWLVWDKLAQYVAVKSMEWLDWLGIFGEPVANNFLAPGSLGDRFFSLLVYIHIFVPLFLLVIMWIHVIRVTQPRINPPRGLALGSLAMFVALAFVNPAVSHAPADLATVPTVLHLDWFYMAFYPLFDRWGPGVLWGLTVGSSIVVCALPWLPPLRRPKAARVLVEKCNGCSRCFADCPYGAVTMRPRTDGLPFEKEAVVDPDLCTSCGICVGACPVSTPFRHVEPLVTAIDLPDFPLTDVKASTLAAMGRLTAGEAAAAPRILVFGCDHGVDVGVLEGPATAALSLPCIGMLPPSFIDFALSRAGADGVLLTGCRECSCDNRLGIRWTEERMAGVRDPYLRKRVPRRRIRTRWGARTERRALKDAVAAFRADLAAAAGEEDESPTPPATGAADD